MNYLYFNCTKISKVVRALTIALAITSTAFAQVPPAPAIVAEPTSTSSVLTFSTVTENSMLLKWNKGNGTNRLVIAKAVNPPDSLPIDNQAYTASATFGSGQDLGGGQYVVFNGTGNTFTVTGLAQNTVYQFAIFEYNIEGTAITNYMATSLDGSNNTLSTEPTVNASEITFSAIDLTSFALTLTKGSGIERLIIAKKGSAVNQVPQDGVEYTANAAFATGTDLGGGNYVVFKGSGNTVALTGLLQGTIYHFAVFEYNGTATSTNYLKNNVATASQASKAPKPTTGTSDLLFSEITENTISLSWIKGNGTKRIIVAHSGTAVSALPTDGTEYTADNNFLNGSDLGAGNYIVFNGIANTCQVNNLKPNTVYHFSIIEYNGSGNATSYFTSGETKGMQSTFATEPSVGTGSIVAKTIGETTLTLKLQPGNGSERIIIAKQGGVVNQFPVDGKSYADNLKFELGVDLGAGNYVMYKGINNEITITGLQAGLTYNFAAFEYNGSTAAANNYLTSNPATLTQQTVLAEPSTQASNITFTTITPTSLSLKWGRGNGTNCIVLAKAVSDISRTPEDGFNYTANDVFGSGSDLGAAHYVVFNGNGNTCEVKGLDPNTTYFFSVFEYNGSGNTINYFTSTLVKNSRSTLTTEPTIAASNISFSNIQGNELTLQFTPGNGDQRIIVARKGFEVNQQPKDGKGYTGIAAAPFGDDLGAGNYVVYKGVENRVTLTGLTEATSYHFAVFEVNGTADLTLNYALTGILTGTQATLETEPGAVASTISFSNVTENSMNVSWVSGAGTNRLLIARAGEINKGPIDGMEYKADAAFGKGATLGAGNFIVYSGSGSSASVTGLTANTRYYFAIVEFNGEKTTNNYNNSPDRPTANKLTLVNKPTVVATNLAITPIQDKSVTVSWLNGNGQRRVVLVKEGTPDFRLPENGKSYRNIASSNFGQAPISSGSETYVCYDGIESSFELTNLEPIRVYYIAVIEYNESDSLATSYQRTGFPVVSNLPEQPTVGAAAMQFNVLTPTTMTVKWTNGNGAYRVLLAKATTPVNKAPIDGINYIANAQFGSGEDLGFANFVVYNGIADSVTLTGLTANTTYHFALYEYNQDGDDPSNYRSEPLIGNKNNKLDTTGGTTAISVVANNGTFNVYPNPTSGTINIDFAKEQGKAVQLRVYNTLGSLVYSSSLAIAANRNQEIHLEELGTGVYTLLVQTDKGVIAERVVIAK